MGAKPSPPKPLYTAPILPKSHLLRHRTAHPFGISRDQLCIVFLNHGCVGMAELLGQPLQFDVAGQGLARIRMTALVDAPMVHLGLDQVLLEPFI